MTDPEHKFDPNDPIDPKVEITQYYQNVILHKTEIENLIRDTKKQTKEIEESLAIVYEYYVTHKDVSQLCGDKIYTSGYPEETEVE